MDIVYIRGLKAEAVIGVYDWERDIRQQLVIDLDLASDNRGAAQDDDIALAVDYDAISRRLLEYVGQSDFQLIETLAERLAALLQSEFGVPWLRLRLAKPGAVAAADEVGVEIERGVRP